VGGPQSPQLLRGGRPVVRALVAALDPGRHGGGELAEPGHDGHVRRQRDLRQLVPLVGDAAPAHRLVGERGHVQHRRGLVQEVREQRPQVPAGHPGGLDALPRAQQRVRQPDPVGEHLRPPLRGALVGHHPAPLAPRGQPERVRRLGQVLHHVRQARSDGVREVEVVRLVVDDQQRVLLRAHPRPCPVQVGAVDGERRQVPVVHEHPAFASPVFAVDHD
jgi:hypothetical protein